MNWLNIESDHVRPTFSFDISYIDELKEAFNWKNTLLFQRDHQQNGTKYNFFRL